MADELAVGDKVMYLWDTFIVIPGETRNRAKALHYTVTALLPENKVRLMASCAGQGPQKTYHFTASRTEMVRLTNA